MMRYADCTFSFGGPVALAGLPLFSLAVLLSACAASPSLQDNLAPRWASAGFGPSEVSEWQADGVTDPASAQKWMSIDPTCKAVPSYCEVGGTSQYTPPSWISTLLRSGMSVDEAAPYLESAGECGGFDNDPCDKLVLSARDLHKDDGLSIPRSVYFAARNIPYDKIGSFVVEKADYDHRKEKIADECGGTIINQEIRYISPFSLGDSRNCFEVAGLSALQWTSPRTMLMVDDSSITPVSRTPEPVEILVDFPLDQQQLNGEDEFIIRGEGEYSFTDQSGADITVPRVRMLMDIDENLEGASPPN